MSKDCREFELEITAAARGELSEEVAHHVSGCSSCASVRFDMLMLASGRSGHLSPQASLALARSARAGRHGPGRRAPLWVAPLVSASASAAALILFFGLAAHRQTVEIPLPTEEAEIATTTDDEEGALVPRLPTLTDMALPESFEASHDVLFIGSDERGES